MAGLAAVLTGTTTRPWFFVSVALVYVIGMIRMVRSSPRSRPRNGLDRFALIGSSIAGLTAAVFLYRAPVQWDARSIWFFHASWFADPSTVYTDLSSTSLFSRPDYPPLTASFGAFSWLFGDPRNDWIAQTATGVLTLAAVGTLSIIIARGIGSASGRAVVAATTTVATLGIIQGNGLDGYVDGLAAVSVATLAIMAFRADDLPLILITALAAALVKNEGFAFLVVVILPLYLLRRRSIRALVPALGAGLAWAVAIRATGADSQPWLLANALPWSADFVARTQTTVFTLLSDPVLRSAVILWLGSLMIALAVEVPRHVRAAVLGMGATAAALVVVMSTLYLATPFNLEWHLATSAVRLRMHLSMVLTAGALAGIIGGWNAARNSIIRRPAPSVADTAK